MGEEVEVGGGRKEEGWVGEWVGGGREAERAAGTAERREGVGLDGYLCFVPAGYNREMEREAGEGRHCARARAHPCKSYFPFSQF